MFVDPDWIIFQDPFRVNIPYPTKQKIKLNNDLTLSEYFGNTNSTDFTFSRSGHFL